MEYYEIIATCHLKKSFKFSKAGEKIGKYISKTMLQDIELSELHEENRFKYYCFDNFYPLEQDKIYKEDRIYIFKLRCLNKEFAEKMKNYLPKTESFDFKVLSVELKRIYRRNIIELYTLTPVVITLDDNKQWVLGDNFSLIEDKIQGNLEKKYNEYFNEKIVPIQNFIQRIEVLNKKAYSLNYKSTKILGNKFRLFINEDEVSQKLAFIAEATGLGEKSSSLGTGFCNAKYLR